MTHTPGPWTFCTFSQTAEGAKLRHLSEDRFIIQGEERMLAILHDSDKRAMSDGRLMTAAPDLLEALQSLVPRAPKRDKQGRIVYECSVCDWSGIQEAMADTDGPDDLEGGEEKPIGACPECNWWFGVHPEEHPGMREKHDRARAAIAKVEGEQA